MSFPKVVFDLIVAGDFAGELDLTPYPLNSRDLEELLCILPRNRAYNLKLKLTAETRYFGDSFRAMENLAALPAFIAVELDVSNCYGIDSAALEAFSRITSLKSLQLAGSGIQNSDLIALLPKMHSLETLDVSDTYIGDGLACLSALPLTSLNLSDSRITAGGFLALRCASIETLNLTNATIRDDVLRQVLQNLPNLKSLNLAGCRYITNDILPEIAKLALTSLNLAGCVNISAAGLYALSKMPLTNLNIAGFENINSDLIYELLQLPLTQLTLAACEGVNDEVLRQLCQFNLTFLDISQVQISEDGFCEFLPQFRNLETLRIARCQGVTDNVLEVVARELSLAQLSVAYCANISDEGLQFLARMPLNNLDISVCERLTSTDALLNHPTLCGLKAQYNNCRFSPQLSQELQRNRELNFLCQRFILPFMLDSRIIPARVLEIFLDNAPQIFAMISSMPNATEINAAICEKMREITFYTPLRALSTEGGEVLPLELWQVITGVNKSGELNPQRLQDCKAALLMGQKVMATEKVFLENLHAGKTPKNWNVFSKENLADVLTKFLFAPAKNEEEVTQGQLKNRLAFLHAKQDESGRTGLQTHANYADIICAIMDSNPKQANNIRSFCEPYVLEKVDPNRPIRPLQVRRFGGVDAGCQML